MAIVEMQKLTLLGLLDQKDKLMRLLTRSGSVEVAVSREIEGTDTCDLSERREELNSALARVTSALSIFREVKNLALSVSNNSLKTLDKYNKQVHKLEKKLDSVALALPTNAPEAILTYANSTNANELELFTPAKLDKYAPADVLTFDAFDGLLATKDDVEEVMSRLEEGMRRINEIKAERVKLAAQVEQLKPYMVVRQPFSFFCDTKRVSVVMGIATKSEELRAELMAYNALAIKCDEMQYSRNVAVVIVALKENAGDVSEVLNKYSFTKCPFNYDVSATDKVKAINNESYELAQELKHIAYELAALDEPMRDVKRLFDYYTIELQKVDAAERCRATSRVLVMTAWTPTDRIEDVTRILNENDAVVALDFAPPEENEVPPTMLNNSSQVSNFEDIVNMFGVPNYREIDPNPFVAFFYSFLFGIMLGDAGYGVVMVAGCLFMLWKSRFTRKPMYLIRAFIWCGVSTIGWGALLGSWFAIDNIGFLRNLEIVNPMNEPMKMLFLSLGIGVLPLATGFIINMVAQVRSGKIVRGIGNNLGWALILIGLLCFGGKVMLYMSAITEDAEWYHTLADVGKYIIIAGVALLVIGGVAGKKNPVKMVTGVLGNFYGGINVMSDLLSYARLFGLGLTSCVIGYVVNLIVGLFVDMLLGGAWYGYLVFAPILIVGHLFNLAINVLGAYVHDSRLQYIEFFNKFYEGTGHLFKPLGRGTKYTFIDNRVAEQK